MIFVQVYIHRNFEGIGITVILAYFKNSYITFASLIYTFTSPYTSALGAASLGDKLYVCGGYDGVSSLSSVECYDTTLKQWIMECSMTKHRSAAGVTVFDGQIYALGGHDGLSIFDSVCLNIYS